MSTIIPTEAEISLPSDFRFDEVVSLHVLKAGTPPPDLGPLAAFAIRKWKGSGLNTIFRPDNSQTPTPLPNPVTPGLPRDNVLEINLTSESLVFSPSLGAVPNRGTSPQGDIFLNGFTYLQTVNDVTFPGRKTGIHVEPGLWMVVPATSNPNEGATVTRMGSIPHGTTIQAQGTTIIINGPPANIPAVDITPFPTTNPINTNPPAAARIRFASQTVTDPNTPRLPQDLSTYNAAGTITQPILDDPNTLLRSHIAGQKITSTTIIEISTLPASPLFGGGVDNIAFLQGDTNQPLPANPNAQTILMNAIFWIETVEHVLQLPAFKVGQPPLALQPEVSVPGQHAPTFHFQPMEDIVEPITIKVKSLQIQYSQTVFLNFKGLLWPHVSVATLVPAHPINLPESVIASATH